MGVLVWHPHTAPEVEEVSPSFGAPQASAPPSCSRFPLTGQHGHREGSTTALQREQGQQHRWTTDTHSNNSSGNQTLLPAGADSKEPKPERTSPLHVYPIHVAFCSGDQNPRTEYSSKQEVVPRCLYFIRVAQNQQWARVTCPMQQQNPSPRAQERSALNLTCQQVTLDC